MKKIEDYLKHYIGCKVSTPDGVATLIGIPGDPILSYRIVNVHFGRMVKTKNSCDGGYDKTRNYGSYLVHAEHLVPISSTMNDMDEINLPGGIKLLLRPLSSMTEWDAIPIKRILFHNHGVGTIKEVIANDWYLNHIGVRSLQSFEITKYLLSEGFDIFGLIDSGLALDATKIEKV